MVIRSKALAFTVALALVDCAAAGTRRLPDQAAR